MSFIMTKPLTAEQKKILEGKTKPSAEDVQKATDELFLNLLLRVAELENKDTGHWLPEEEVH